jgi:hypothetical protein
MAVIIVHTRLQQAFFLKTRPLRRSSSGQTSWYADNLFLKKWGGRKRIPVEAALVTVEPLVARPLVAGHHESQVPMTVGCGRLDGLISAGL